MYADTRTLFFKEAYGFKDQDLVDLINKVLSTKDNKPKLEKIKTKTSNSKENAGELLVNLIKSEESKISLICKIGLSKLEQSNQKHSPDIVVLQLFN